MSPWPERLFVASDAGASRLGTRLRTSDDQIVELPVGRWHGLPDGADQTVLQRATGPVLDVGCGPGRHVAELVSAGRDALGIDLSRQAVLTARRRGAPVVRASVFGPVPRAGEWATALLLDGNIGIGGDARALLRRVGELLAPNGRVLVELSPPTSRAGRFQARVEQAGRSSTWFPWARVTAHEITAVARDAAYDVIEVWDAGGRWFADLRRRAVDEGAGSGVSGLESAS